MQNLLKKILIVMVMFFVFNTNLLAIDCKYPSAGLTVSYDENSDVTINYDEFSQGTYYANLWSLIKWGTGIYNTNEIEIDQTLFEKYQGYSCPTSMYVCEYSNWSINLPSLNSLGYAIENIFTTIPCTFGAMNLNDCDYIEENAWAAITMGEKKLYILTQEEYENSDLPIYEGGFISDDIDVSVKEAFEKCRTGSDAWYAKAIDFVCWSSWALPYGIVDGIVLETLIGDGIDLLYYRQSNCNIVEYEGQYTAFNINCGTLKNSIFSFIDSISAYSKCGDDLSCRTKYISEVNQKEENIKSYCSQILQNYDYSGGQKDCLKECLTIKEILNSYKKGTDLYDNGTSNNGECGVSGRLLGWILNIIKWIKYIIPIVVIVMGIIDFIRAIASDKDDEMKKAQGRFIKRLIAAALIFIVPFILEFVLDKMGFEVSSCGIIRELD